MNRARVIARLKKFEGVVPHMYRCTGGEVTIGVGHAIAAVDEAAKLAWRAGGSAAAAEQARADFNRIADAVKGLPAPDYAHLTQCRMAEEDIDGLLAADIERFESHLAAALPQWPSYPETVQEALFDMGYNLGVAGLLKFQHLLAAVDAGQWAVAAGRCHRMGIGEARNQETADLLLQANSA